MEVVIRRKMAEADTKTEKKMNAFPEGPKSQRMEQDFYKRHKHTAPADSSLGYMTFFHLSSNQLFSSVTRNPLKPVSTNS